MLDGILEENQLCLLGKGGVVVTEVVLQDRLDLIHIYQIFIDTVVLLCAHLQQAMTKVQHRKNVILSELLIVRTNLNEVPKYNWLVHKVRGLQINAKVFF